MKIKYIGVKVNGCTAFQRESGIKWMQGDEHEIRDELAKRMLRHPDIFAVAQEQEAKKPAITLQPQTPIEPVTVTGDTLAPGAEIKPLGQGEGAPKFLMAAAEGAIVLDDLDKAALHALAKESGVKVHHAAGADTVRRALIEAFPVAQ